MRRIAVVQSDMDVLSSACELLAESGWDAVPCADGAAAVSVLRHERPDVILLDPWLQTRDSGWHMLQELKIDSVTRTIPVVLWSVDRERLREKETWLTEHGIPVLAEPFEIDDLSEAIESALERVVSRPGSHRASRL
jgi:CheY-like chemotaxis protein